LEAQIGGVVDSAAAEVVVTVVDVVTLVDVTLADVVALTTLKRGLYMTPPSGVRDLHSAESPAQLDGPTRPPTPSWQPIAGSTAISR